jgi:hypothetical protein
MGNAAIAISDSARHMIQRRITRVALIVAFIGLLLSGMLGLNM